MPHSNGTQGYDLYHPLPSAQPVTPCPEAAFSLTMKGRLHGQETLLTVRAMTAEALKRNIDAVKGILDAVQPPPAPDGQGEGFCQKHQLVMTHNEKHGSRWFSHRLPDGSFCKGK
jgi:hypothetical protein